MNNIIPNQNNLRFHLKCTCQHIISFSSDFVYYYVLLTQQIVYFIVIMNNNSKTSLAATSRTKRQVKHTTSLATVMNVESKSSLSTNVWRFFQNFKKNYIKANFQLIYLPTKHFVLVNPHAQIIMCSVLI